MGPIHTEEVSLPHNEHVCNSGLDSSAAATNNQKRTLVGEIRPDEPKRQNLGAPENGRETYCYECKISFSRPYTFRRHVEHMHGMSRKFQCDHQDCGETFGREDTLNRHTTTQHGGGKVSCPECGHMIRRDGLPDHLKTKTCRNNRDETYALGQGSGRTFLNDGVKEVTDEIRNEAIGLAGEVSQVCKPWPGLVESLRTAEGRPVVQNLLSVTESVDEEPAQRECITEESHRNPQEVGQRLQEVIVHSSHAAGCTSDVAAALEIIPDSPRLTFQPDKLSDLIPDDRSLEEILTKVDKSWTALQMTEALDNKANLAESGSFFYRAGRMPRQCYSMQLGTNCALCNKGLGNYVEDVYEHAKFHAQHPNKPKFECRDCGVKFAFETDFKLHSSGLEIWSFCQELPPTEAYDESDWVAEATSTARQAFVDLLRHWESLQLRWYLSAIGNLLGNQVLRKGAPKALTAEVPARRVSDTASRPFTDAPKPTTSYYENDTYLNSMIEEFKKFSMLKGHAQLSSPELYSKELLTQYQSSLWNAVKNEGCSFFGALQSVLPNENAQVHRLVAERALHKASKKGNVLRVRKLLNEGVQVDAILALDSARPNTALVCAIINGHSEIADLLIQHGANVDYDRAEDRCTPLHLASVNHLEKVVNLLLVRGAIVDVLDVDGNTPLLSALKSHVDSSRIRRARKIVQTLIEHGTDLNLADSRCSQTALHRACIINLPEIVHCLVQHGAMVNREDKFGHTPLICAAEHGSVESVKILLEWCKSTSAICKQYTPLVDGTALHLAAMRGRCHVVETLLDHGAAIDVEDLRGMTALAYAVAEERVDVVRLLLKRGAKATLVSQDATYKFCSTFLGPVMATCSQWRNEDLHTVLERVLER